MFSRVASFTGAWIETPGGSGWPNCCSVASFTGAWIETRGADNRKCEHIGRILYGCVD